MKYRPIGHLSHLFLSLAVAFVTSLLIANIMAGKLIQIHNIVVPSAIIIFPVIYIIGDVLTGVYGLRQAKLAIWLGFAANILMVIIFALVLYLPYPD